MAIALTSSDVGEIQEIFAKYAYLVGNGITEEEAWIATVIEFIRTNKAHKPELMRLLLEDTSSTSLLEESIETEVTGDSPNETDYTLS